MVFLTLMSWNGVSIYFEPPVAIMRYIAQPTSGISTIFKRKYVPELGRVFHQNGTGG